MCAPFIREVSPFLINFISHYCAADLSSVSQWWPICDLYQDMRIGEREEGIRNSGRNEKMEVRRNEGRKESLMLQ